MLQNPFAALSSGPRNGNDNIRRIGSTRDQSDETISQALFGVNIKILYDDNSDYYRENIEYSTLGLVDGSRRRISYSVFRYPSLGFV